MSGKSEEERIKDAEKEIVSKIILGEIKPDLVQTYRIIKNCIDSAIGKGVYNIDDISLLSKAFDVFRTHINDFNSAKETEKEVRVKPEPPKSRILKEGELPVPPKKVEKSKDSKPPRRRGK